MKDLKHIIADTKKKVINYILEYDKTCGGDYGNHFHMLKMKLKIGEPVLKDALNELFLEKKIKVADNFSGPITFLNYEHPEIKKLQEDEATNI